jgi:hypothetical protein
MKDIKKVSTCEGCICLSGQTCLYPCQHYYLKAGAGLRAIDVVFSVAEEMCSVRRQCVLCLFDTTSLGSSLDADSGSFIFWR